MAERWPDLSQTEFARKIGVSQSQLSQLLSGSKARRPGAGIRVLIRIRHSLNVPLDELLGLSSKEERQPQVIDSIERMRRDVLAEVGKLTGATSVRERARSDRPRKAND